MTDFRVGVPVAVGGAQVAVSRILAPNAGPMTGPGTNSYLVGSRQLTLIDPGPRLPAHIDAIMAALEGRPLQRILVTHTHADHSPAAQQIADLTGAELVGLAPPVGGRNDRTFSPARLYRHGEILTGAEFTIELIHTPGHVSNHFCYLLGEEKMLFTGDHILQGTTSVILPPDGDMGDYMASLQLLRTRSLNCLAPGHGDVITEPMQAIDALIAHRNRREEKIVRVMQRRGGGSLEELTLEVYDDVEPHLLPWAQKTLEAHLIKLRREARAREIAAGWQLEPAGAEPRD